MDELIGRLAVKAGVNDAVTEKTIGIIPGFLCHEGSSHNVQTLNERTPGAASAISASAGRNRLTAFTGNRLMAAGSKLLDLRLDLRLGLGMSLVQDVAHELFRFGHDKIGTDGINEIAGTSSLSQFA
jgi:hypothetical protein